MSGSDVLWNICNANNMHFHIHLPNNMACYELCGSILVFFNVSLSTNSHVCQHSGRNNIKA